MTMGQSRAAPAAPSLVTPTLKRRLETSPPPAKTSAAEKSRGGGRILEFAGALASTRGTFASPKLRKGS